jgi:hypothetical protein
LNNVKTSLKDLEINLRGSQIKRKKEFMLGLQNLEILEEFQCLSNEELTLRASLQKKIAYLYEADEFFCYSRSSEN